MPTFYNRLSGVELSITRACLAVGHCSGHYSILPFAAGAFREGTRRPSSGFVALSSYARTPSRLNGATFSNPTDFLYCPKQFLSTFERGSKQADVYRVRAYSSLRRSGSILLILMRLVHLAATCGEDGTPKCPIHGVLPCPVPSGFKSIHVLLPEHLAANCGKDGTPKCPIHGVLPCPVPSGRRIV